MSAIGTAASRSADAALELFFRLAATGLFPARVFLSSLPAQLSARTGRLNLEIVSHCWNYAHLLAYQLSSLVHHPPTRIRVRMTVFFSPEDRKTADLLRFFGDMRVAGVDWNWQALDTNLLFRRAIGRNRAALATGSDWIWFTDCDVVFQQGCLDALAEQLQGRTDRLVYPRQEQVTSLLSDDDPMLNISVDPPRLVGIDPARFTPRSHDEARGPFQITHGEVARAAGYCASLSFYQKPADRWRKAREDRAFRWLLRTDGVALDVPGAYRIRHASKGRYGDRRVTAWIRKSSRRLGSWLQERRHQPVPTDEKFSLPPSRSEK
ncbi:MAG TPA: glycosyltransferase family A protein [Thermoanaerobaculia bacterium]|nr:glycosyltransferase family A protein [Thermoanaerobaculia bacterium]